MNTQETRPRLIGWEIVLLSLAVALFLAGALVGFFMGKSPVEGIGVFGVGATLAGLLLAAMIYFNQRRTAEASELRVLAGVSASVAALVKDDETNSSDVADDNSFPDEYGALGAPVPGEANVRQLAPADVPLQLIHDLVEGWSQAGQSGTWAVGDLRTVLRRAGKGNHSWWFIFERPDGRHLLKLSRGGRGNQPDAIIVTEVKE
ncbi:hypothetical protein [Clavibacter sp. VKM Ac-2542]|uniref:hypothetical protein n=1 Tax=Clavibacter sp. VKM Ac-2542 TaxID=2783811 RepID=UPI00188B73BC|nr:hypothetical protein [Clavibacter sp. VKM Ac-2542]MBF4621380.1 hypothetical protein [Clavibacter sp. VKM Ac-2542]